MNTTIVTGYDLGALVLTGGPTTEPLSLDEAKLHLRVDVDEDDELIAVLIEAARRHIETFLRRQLITATYTLYLPQFPSWAAEIRLPRPPLQTVTEITYFDTENVEQLLDASVYVVDSAREPARIVLATGQTWPSTYDILNAVAVVYEAGYGDDANNVPANIRAACKLLVGDMYQHREVRIDGRLEDNPTLMRLLWATRLLEV